MLKYSTVFCRPAVNRITGLTVTSPDKCSQLQRRNQHVIDPIVGQLQAMACNWLQAMAKPPFQEAELWI